MTIETLDRGQELQDQLTELDLPIRKMKEAIAFIENNGEKHHYHLKVLTFGIVKDVTSWHFLPDQFLEMLRPALAKLETDRAAVQAQFDAL